MKLLLFDRGRNVSMTVEVSSATVTVAPFLDVMLAARPDATRSEVGRIIVWVRMTSKKSTNRGVQPTKTAYASSVSDSVLLDAMPVELMRMLIPVHQACSQFSVCYMSRKVRFTNACIFTQMFLDLHAI